ncbi:MAG: DNA-binding protein WhiA [Clostridia bacterium]|nr:DNA-binding protein WhiA [Clostridia bacterium]MBO4429011.1 DNA-binding protein WhiA [Clostridia bacterium]
MSFSSEKKAAAAFRPQHDDECEAMLYGLILFSNKFSADELSFRTENAEVSDIFCGLLLGVLEISATPKMHVKKNGTIFKISVSDADALSRIALKYASCGYNKIDRSVIPSSRMQHAFLRGAFLACGYIDPPERSYRLEFSVRDADLAVDLALVLSENVNVMPKMSARKADQIIYYRDSDLIIDFLNLIGLTSASFDIMNCQIEKEIRNNENRKNNFDIANIERNTGSSMMQIEAITALIKSGEFDALPVGLRTTAKLRMKYPDMSLEALGKAENPPLSKSQVSKRLKQIIEIYKNK